MKRVYLYEENFNEDLFLHKAIYNLGNYIWNQLHKSFKENKFNNIRIEIYYLT